VDDESDLLWALRYALGDEGYEVETVSSAARLWPLSKTGGRT